MHGFSDVATPVTRVEQRVAYWCGAACATMVTDFYGLSILQNEAYSAIHNPERFASEQLWSDPLGIRDFLNLKIGGIVTFRVSDFAATEIDVLLSRLYYNAAIIKIPSIVLVQGGAHWVVVDSVRVSESSLGERSFVGVEIENPWFGLKPNVFVPVDEFVSSWLSPNRFGVQWRDRFVVISDDSGDRVFKPDSAAIILGGGGGGDDPTSMAILGMEQAGFANIRPIESGGGAPVVEPVRVHVLDSEAIYFIVPLDAVNNPRYSNFIYVAVSSAGALLGSTDLDGALQVFSDEEASVIFRSKVGADFSLRAGLYWTSSFYTMSRFDVFRIADTPNGILYLLPSGEVVRSLDAPHAHGG